MKNLILLILLTFVFSIRLLAQEAPKIKFEKVSKEELAMTTYANDSTAEAVILYDDGTSYVKYEVDKGFVLNYERFVRIKILKQSGVNWGNFTIALYSNGANHENMSPPNGTTFNLENGKIVKSELKKDAIFREQENKYWETVRLSMPAVKVGSVIDLKYSINTNLTWNLRTWKFQYTIPVKWSQYRVVYPEYYTYNQSVFGYHKLLYNKESQDIELINYTTKDSNSGGVRGGPTHTVNQTISYSTQIFDYAAANVPSMKEEPFLTSLNNYTTQVKFELASVNLIKMGGKLQNYTTSWIDIARQLTDEENFGQQLTGNNFVEDDVKQLTKGTTTNMDKLIQIFNHVQRTMKWDKFKSAYTSKNLKKAYTDKTGNSADINLLLNVMLNSAGISANPVILSTRQNGILSVTHPSISDCNYVIVQAIVDGKPILLDATEPNLQPGYLPLRCLNGEGHLITKEGSKPVPLTNLKSIENTRVELAIKDGKMTGTIKTVSNGLSAFNFRESVKAVGGKQEYFNKVKNSSTELDFLEYHYNNLDSLTQPVNIEYKIAFKEGSDGNTGIIYLDPILINRQKNNPFTAPTREYPVDFGVSYSETYTMQLTIPEGYGVEELPKPKSLIMEGKGGQFNYQVLQVGNKIVLNLSISIVKSLFIPSEYQILKSFYDLIISKEGEQIVLKKIKV